MAHVDLETGFVERPEAPVEVHGPSAPSPTPDAEAPASLESSGVLLLQRTIEGALQGTLPIDEPLEAYEVKKFSGQHVSLVMDYCAGLDRDALELKYGFNRQYLNILLRHPFARAIQQALMSRLADRCTDPMERIKAYAGEMLDIKISIVRDPATPKTLRNHIADNLLDRAGFGARQKLEVSKEPEAAKPSVPQHHLARIADALEASQRVATVDYSRHTSAPARREDSVVASNALESEAGTSDSRSEASLGGLPADKEKVA